MYVTLALIRIAHERSRTSFVPLLAIRSNVDLNWVSKFGIGLNGFIKC